MLPSSSSEKDAVRSLPTKLDRFFTEVITDDFNNPPPCPCPWNTLQMTKVMILSGNIPRDMQCVNTLDAKHGFNNDDVISSSSSVAGFNAAINVVANARINDSMSYFCSFCNRSKQCKKHELLTTVACVMVCALVSVGLMDLAVADVRDHADTSANAASNMLGPKTSFCC